MRELLLDMLWLLLYGYYVEQMGTLQKGIGKRLMAAVLAVGVLLAVFFWGRNGGFIVSWLLTAILFLLFDLFFDEEAFRRQWLWILLPGAAMAAAAVFPADLFLENGAVFYLFFALLAKKRGYLNWKNGGTAALIYGMLTLFLRLFQTDVLVFWDGSSAGPEEGMAAYGKTVLPWSIVFLEVLLFWMAEGTLFSYKKGFEFQAERFEQEILSCQYEEIKAIYLDMRGWRHDYHNHLQVIKAQLALGNLEETKQYLDELEQDLDRVDSYIKSGNLMADAILNSKLTLAKAGGIAVSCKAQLPEQLFVEDVDLCVILGNLLDNALEACEKIPKEARFLRIYMAVNKSQLYISIQNSAKEELDFNERNYITNKRGSHGFGMRRVKAMIEKYEGYLNLANEPGIFAAEVTMPVACK